MQRIKRLIGQTVRCFILCIILTWPAAVRADDASRAKELFDRGLEDLKAGHYDTACPAIAESLRLEPWPGTLFTLAVCEMEAGHVVRAADRFDEYVRLYESLSSEQKEQQSERFQVAKEQRDKLRREVARLMLKLPATAPPGTVVKLDGNTMTPEMLGNALPVDPGEHEITTQAPGGSLRREKVTLNKGKWRSLVVAVDAVSGKPVSNSPPSPVRPVERFERGVITGAENREVPVSMAMRRLVLPHLTMSPYIAGEYTRWKKNVETREAAGINVGISLGLGGDLQLDVELGGLRYVSPSSSQLFDFFSGFWPGRSGLGGTVRLFANDRVEFGVRSHVYFDLFPAGMGVDLGIPVRFHLGRRVRIESGVFVSTLPIAEFQTWLALPSKVLGYAPPSPGIPLEVWVNPVPTLFFKVGTGVGIFEDDRSVMVSCDAAIGGTVRLGTRGRLDIMGSAAWTLASTSSETLAPMSPFPVVGLGITAYLPLATRTRQAAPSSPR